MAFSVSETFAKGFAGQTGPYGECRVQSQKHQLPVALASAVQLASGDTHAIIRIDIRFVRRGVRQWQVEEQNFIGLGTTKCVLV